MYNPQVQPIGAQLLSRAFENLGNNISDGIKEYKAKKEQDAAITGTLEGMLSPQAVQQYSALDPEFAKSVEKFNSHSMNLKDKQMFLGKVGGYKATLMEQEKKRMQDMQMQIQQQQLMQMQQQNAMGQQQATNRAQLNQFANGMGQGVLAPEVQAQYRQDLQDPGIQAARSAEKYGYNPSLIGTFGKVQGQLSAAEAKAKAAEDALTQREDFKKGEFATRAEAIAALKEAEGQGLEGDVIPSGGGTFSLKVSSKKAPGYLEAFMAMMGGNALAGATKTAATNALNGQQPGQIPKAPNAPQAPNSPQTPGATPVFSNEDEFNEAAKNGSVKEGDTVVINGKKFKVGK